VFVIDQKPTYWYPVEVELTDDETGRKKKFTFDGQFNRLPQDELGELVRTREDGEAPLKDSEVLDKVFRGWRKVQNADGTEVEVNEVNRAKLLAIFPVQPSIVRAFLKSIGVEGYRKN